MDNFTLYAERDGSREMVQENISQEAATELAEADAWQEGADAVLLAQDGHEYMLTDDWELLIGAQAEAT